MDNLYQIDSPLSTSPNIGCMGQCEYCYLNTRLGDKPFVRVYVNIEDILDTAKKYINERLPEITFHCFLQ